MIRLTSFLCPASTFPGQGSAERESSPARGGATAPSGHLPDRRAGGKGPRSPSAAPGEPGSPASRATPLGSRPARCVSAPRLRARAPPLALRPPPKCAPGLTVTATPQWSVWAPETEPDLRGRGTRPHGILRRGLWGTPGSGSQTTPSLVPGAPRPAAGGSQTRALSNPGQARGAHGLALLVGPQLSPARVARGLCPPPPGRLLRARPSAGTGPVSPGAAGPRPCHPRGPLSPRPHRPHPELFSARVPVPGACPRAQRGSPALTCAGGLVARSGKAFL